ncbi:hypothetical protein ACFOY4_01675 [Actinomadura syzygii]|uniref:Uncharacterized protein n=1 Tax=Actinomadura syzygii TaxID=1427538 RepID=A0A5D0TUM6_9ACTN|nr:hypothetical protein [Actinomadura syzygii]TYC08549.1 hypothetical protein FXF65_37270 [Actinomadura syzygii]
MSSTTNWKEKAVADHMTPEDERRINELLARHPALLQPEAIELGAEVKRLRAEVQEQEGWSKDAGDNNLVVVRLPCGHARLAFAHWPTRIKHLRYCLVCGCDVGVGQEIARVAELHSPRGIRAEALGLRQYRSADDPEWRASFEVGKGVLESGDIVFRPAFEYRCTRCGTIGGRAQNLRPTLADLDNMADRHECLPPVEKAVLGTHTMGQGSAMGILDVVAVALTGPLPEHQNWTVNPLRLDTDARPGALERYALDKTTQRPGDGGQDAAEMSDDMVETTLWALNTHHTGPGTSWYTDGVQAGTSLGTVAKIEFYLLPDAAAHAAGLLI